ncbi:MAG: flagellar motor protein MotB [Paracoccaceae bacterium]
MSAKQNAPIIIKKKKVVAGGGHHGGAWKVAYADFVTAMMAFFLLMWLINATTEKQRKGVADYFNPTIPVNRVSGGGDGAFGGDSIFSEESLARNGIGAAMRHPTDAERARGDADANTDDVHAEAADAAAIAAVQDALSALSGESMVAEEALRHIVTRVTDEGLIIELFDLPDVPLFAPETADPAPILRELAQMLAGIFALVTNDLAINGHLASQSVVVADNPVWDLSGRRADAMRGLLESHGITAKRIQRISGFADRKQVAANPMAVRNNRVELILLRKAR